MVLLAGLCAVAMCCSVLQYVVVLQCVAMCCSGLRSSSCSWLVYVLLQCVAVSMVVVLQCVAMCDIHASF